jgi:hypothetical protein
MSMKRPVSLFLFLGFTALSAQTSVPAKGIQAIDQGFIKDQLFTLSSDAMQGRETPSAGLDSAAAVITKVYKTLGLKPVDANGSYFYRYNLLKNDIAEPNTLSLNTGSGNTPYLLKDDFLPTHYTANGTASGPVVFAGYGITAPEYAYDDYAGIDAKGKIVLVFTDEPRENDSTSVFKGTKMTDYGKIAEKVINAKNHEAVGILLVTDPNNHRFIKPPNDWASLMKTAPKGAIPLTLDEKKENKIVAIRIGKKLAEDLFAPTGKTMNQWQAILDSTMTGHPMEIPGTSVFMEATLKSEQIPTQNVIGILEGRDPVLKNEAIVFGAHFDHLGTRNDTTVYNGADDNASGTVGVMTMAKAFAAAGVRPKRSLVFAAWSGEEIGLFGSRYYVGSAPLFPLDKTVLNINFDMIGRNDSSRVDVSGIEYSPDLDPIVKKANEGIGLTLETEHGVSGSDHVPFHQKKVPVIGFFSGMHEDYHKPGDDPEKCSIAGMAQILKLAFNIAWTVADSDIRFFYVEAESKRGKRP